MKILMVIPYFMPAISYGGPVKMSFDVARGLVSRGHEVTVATTDVFDAGSRIRQTTEMIDGIKVLRFRNVSNALAKKINGYLPLMIIPWLVKNCRKFDTVYCHDFFSLQAITAGFVSRGNELPFIFQPHGSFTAARLSSGRGKARLPLIKRIFTWLFGGILRSSRTIIALTEKEKTGIVEAMPTLEAKVVVVPNGLDIGEFLHVQQLDLYRKYNIPQQPRIIGFIGRLSYIKGVDLSLEVLATLKDRLEFVFLVIGPDEGELEQLKKLAKKLGIADRVIFAGILGGEEKLQVMKSCDMFLFTSRDEGLPMAVLEAAALGVSQVTSTECNVPELAEYQAGFVHACDDTAALADSVHTLLSDVAVRQTMARNARLMVKERFSIEAMLDGIEHLMVRSASE